MLPALLTAGASILGGVLQGNSAERAKDAQVHAEMAAAQERARAQQEVARYQAPGVGVYNTSLNALSERLGLGGTTQNAASTASGVNGFDADAYMAMYSDVAQRAAEGVREGFIGPGKEWATPQEWAAFHYMNSGRAEGRQAPTVEQRPSTLPAEQAGAGGPGVFGNALNPTYTAPTYTPPPEFSFDIADFVNNPAYKFALEQGSGEVLANASVTGALQSGAALKALQDRAQKTAYGFYDDERDFAYGKYTDDRDFGRSVFESDRNFGRNTYEDDRDYLTSRYDRNTDDLFRLTGIGQNALNATTNALVGEGNATATGLEGIGQAQAGNALAQGDIWSGVAGDLAGALAGVLKKKRPASTVEA